MDIFFLVTILPIIYLLLIVAFFVAIFNISRNSNRQVKLLAEILDELRANKNNDIKD